MLRVSNKEIYLTRGDTALLNIKIGRYGCKEPYELSNGDRVFFTVKSTYEEEEFIFQKIFLYEVPVPPEPEPPTPEEPEDPENPDPELPEEPLVKTEDTPVVPDEPPIEKPEIIFKILPEDTSILEFGDYTYDVEIKTFDNDVYTIIPPSKFVLEPEVTYSRNE